MMKRLTIAIWFALLFAISIGAGFLYSQTVRVQTDRPIRSFTFAYATGATNQTAITITCLDANGQFIPYARFKFWLSTAGDGGPITTVTPVGTDTINILGSIGSIDNGLTTTGMGFQFPVYITASSAGTARVGVLNAAKTLWFPVAQPANAVSGRAVGTKLVTGNYGQIIWGEITNGFWAIIPQTLAAHFGGLYQ